jgi:hypothetical protein
MAGHAEIHDEVCRQGFDAQLGSFVQSYGSKEVDASLITERGRPALLYATQDCCPVHSCLGEILVRVANCL